MQSHLYHLHTLTALHVGVGQGSGIIDLPIARERATHLPVVPGSALKGVLREELKPDPTTDRNAWEALFGPERIVGDNASFAGALAVGDARLLCLPVRTFTGTFAYATCPLVLHRYARDSAAAKLQNLPTVPTVTDETARVSSHTVLQEGNKIYLEEMDLTAQTSDADAWAAWIAARVFAGDAEWQKLFQERFAIVPDAVFDFLAETATEVRARVRLKEGTRTVAKGALWYEENLPAESILWGILGVDRSFHNSIQETAQDLIGRLPQKTRLQIGGKATVGRGQVHWLLG